MTDGFDLLNKKELRVTEVRLNAADLAELAKIVAAVLGVEPAEVLVTDYLDDTLTFDVLRPTLYSHPV
jgi:hypothetical protein